MSGGRVAQLLARIAGGRSALHVIAHPDDEHAGALVWLAHRGAARTSLVSLTRGEAGANLVGPELGDDLGVRRTFELVAAASVYGVDRVELCSAPDYGYSRRLEEAWTRWPRRTLLGELVAAIRRERPVVLLSRFFGGEGDGHAHHQAAGLLAREAAELAGYARAFPEQGLLPWRPLRCFVGQVPPGERVDVTIAPEEALVRRADAGYLLHATQDPRSLLATEVSHRRAAYQCLGGPVTGLFDDLPADPAELLARGVGRPLVGAARDAVARAAEAAGAALAGASGEVLADLRAAEAGLRAVPEEDADLVAPLARDLAEAAARLEGTLEGPHRARCDAAVSAEPPAISAALPRWIVTDAGPVDDAVAIRNHGTAPADVSLRRRAGDRRGAVVWLSLAPGETRSAAVPLPPIDGSCELALELAGEGGPEPARSVVEIDTPLGRKRVTRPAVSRAVRTGARIRTGARVGLVPGPSPIATRALAALGVDAEPIDMRAWPAGVPDDLDVLLVGSRAFAAHPRLEADVSPFTRLLGRGAHVVLLHQTPELDPRRHAPLPGHLPDDAEEVCEEDSPVRLLSPEHPLLCAPNRLDASDFDGWFEARGSKFWSEWDTGYVPLVELQDPGRPPQRGVWLSAEVGGGRFTYCALALERQLWAGVPGGFRILANLVS